MFVIFKRPKPMFFIGQMVFVLSGDVASAQHYMIVRKREWVRQSGYAQWNWFYTGTIFRAEASKLVLVSADTSQLEKNLSAINWFP
jgi:hypothetical protein